MGYMTVVSILNDGWHLLQENPDKFMDNISRGMRGEYRGSVVQEYGVQGFANPMEVHRSFHANESNLLLVGQNHMENVADINPNRMDDFYLTYKVKTLQQAAYALSFAEDQVFAALANTIADVVRRENKDPAQVAETFKAYQALDTRKKTLVLKLVQKNSNNPNKGVFK